MATTKPSNPRVPFDSFNFDPFFDIDRLKRRILAIEKKVGLGKTDTPVVTGSTDSQKLASLISALGELGLIDNQTV